MPYLQTEFLQNSVLLVCAPSKHQLGSQGYRNAIYFPRSTMNSDISRAIHLPPDPRTYSITAYWQYWWQGIVHTYVVWDSPGIFDIKLAMKIIVSQSNHSHFQRIPCTPSDTFTLISSWPSRRTVSGLLRCILRCRIDLCPTDRLQLNNYVQTMFRNQTTLTWTVQQTGEENQQHESPWEAIAFSAFSLPRQFSILNDFDPVNHIQYGIGSAPNRDAAKEEAARQALINLRGY